MSLSVIILSKTASNLIPCIQAIHVHESADDVRIIVVDDGVEWENVPFPLVTGQDLEIRSGVKPFVYARNCNLGIKAVGDDDVVLLNDDALLKTSDGFSKLQRAAVEHPEYGVIASTCNNVGNVNQWPQGIGLRDEPRMVCFVCVFIPRRTIETVGLLDEEFTGYGYDDDSYCLRVRRAGLKIGIYDGCYVDHGSLVSTYRGSPTGQADMRHNAAVFQAKYGASNHEL